MDYLTKYYKNLAESLQQKLNILQSQLDESIMPRSKSRGKPIRMPNPAFDHPGDILTRTDEMGRTVEVTDQDSHETVEKAKKEYERRRRGKGYYEGEPSKKLDPVGKEDGDIDNDGDKDSTDKYLLNRRKAIGKAMAGKTLKEESESDKKELARINADRKAEGKPPFKTLDAALTYYEQEDEREERKDYEVKI